MPKPTVARVVIESPLPQLGVEFDYLVPERLRQSCEVGCRVAVQLGNSKKLTTGFVVDLMASSPFANREIQQVFGPAMLTSDLLECSRIAARRQVVSVGEFLRLAMPAYMPSQEIPAGYESLSGNMTFRTGVWQPGDDTQQGNLAFLSSPVPSSQDGKLLFDWATVFLSAGLSHLRRGQSTILIVPEESDFEPVRVAAELNGITDALQVLQEKRRSARYQNFWRARNGAARIFIGTRSAVLHPAHQLGLIGIFDDLDESLRPKGSPYIHARELALIRAKVTGARVILAAPYRSLEFQRLVNIGFATELTRPVRPPRISHYSTRERFPSEFFSLVRTGLKQGSVLVLVPNRDWAVAVVCKSCDKSARCGICGGPAHMPVQAKASCRLCFADISSCSECGSRSLQPGRSGASKLAAELGRAFPGIVVRDFSGDAAKTKVGQNDLVVATPSAAPRQTTGYSALAIVDCASWLNRPSIRAEQFAIRDWQEAIALLAPDGKAALFGVNNAFGNLFALQDFIRYANLQLRELSGLRFPPAVRVCSVTGPPQLVSLAAQRAIESGAEVVNQSPTSMVGQTRLLLRFSYQDGMAVAAALQEVSLRASAKGSVAGRRTLKIAMDDIGDL